MPRSPPRAWCAPRPRASSPRTARRSTRSNPNPDLRRSHPNPNPNPTLPLTLPLTLTGLRLLHAAVEGLLRRLLLPPVHPMRAEDSRPAAAPAEWRPALRRPIIFEQPVGEASLPCTQSLARGACPMALSLILCHFNFVRSFPPHAKRPSPPRVRCTSEILGAPFLTSRHKVRTA